MVLFDMYRRGPSSEVRRRVSFATRTILVSALFPARCGLSQLQWKCEQRWLQRQLLVIHDQGFGERVEPQLQLGRCEREQQQPVQRLFRAPCPSLY